MKFSASLTMLAAGAAMAEPTLLRRQISAVTSIMTKVLDKINALDGAVQAFDGTEVTGLRSASSTMDATVRQAIVDAGSIQPLTLDEAYQFQPLSDELNAAGDAFLNDLISKIPLFERTGMCPTVLANVTTLGDNVLTLMHTIASKFPTEGQNKDAETISHFESSFTNAEDKLRACVDVSTTTLAPTATVIPSTLIPTPISTPYVTKPTGGANHEAKNNGTFTSVHAAPSSTSTYVAIAGAPTTGLSVAGAVVAAALLSMLL